MQKPPPSDRSSSTGSVWPALALSGASVVIAFLLVEIGFRLATDVPVFELENWRVEHVAANRLGARARFDAELGWETRPNYTSDGYTTLDHGIRRNFAEQSIRQGAVLAVGDSFTEGWDDVRDAETWPAHLERLLRTPVVNGGVGGYGTDQIVLRAERLLPVVRPKTLILGIFEEDIARAGHAPYGGPKPHFMLAEGKLVFHPPVFVDAGEASRWSVGESMRDAAGHSAMLDFVLGRLIPTTWYAGKSGSYTRVANDPVAVTCALLGRLQRRTVAEGIRMLVFLQHGYAAISEGDTPTENARAVSRCATAAGIPVVDEFQSLRAIAVTDPEGFKAYYTLEGDTYWHMSSKGNEHAAMLLARRLAE